jgi:hypothetical protein
MSQMMLRFESDQLNKYMDNLIARFPVELADATRRTAIAGTRIAKEILPKRGGNLIRSVAFTRRDQFTYLLSHSRSLNSASEIKYADAVEAGRRAVTIFPRRAKMLLIPLRKDVTTTGGQIKASKKRQLFAMFEANKKRKRGNKLKKRQIYDRVGLALAKKARQKRRAGQWNYRDKIRPKVEFAFKQQLFKKFKTLGFV